TDDEGWRLEIPGLPELTEVGANRCFDLEEKSCLLPQLGSGATTDNFGSGFFSKADYVDILKYAKARNIEVIPEIDMPAHARAAVVSMEARYDRLMEEGKEA
ncbi:family 20 glycosylhydrolase, partial [Vibrio parahaemolyticus]